MEHVAKCLKKVLFYFKKQNAKSIYNIINKIKQNKIIKVV